MFIGFYNYTVVLTYIGLGTAVCGIHEAVAHNYKEAILCLLICGLCDAFDGAIARTNKKRSEEARWFGIQIDSLCDLVCFGVLPAVIGYALLPGNMVTLLSMMFYILAAVIRLAYFNVQEITKTGSGKREYYLGMPVTSSALIMPIVALITAFDRVTWEYLYPAALALLGFAFIFRFKVKKPYLVGLTALVVVGLAVLYFTLRYGDSITCMKPLADIINPNV